MSILWRFTKMLVFPKLFSVVVVIVMSSVISSAPYVFSFLGRWLVDDVLQVGGVPLGVVLTEPERLRMLVMFFLVSVAIHLVTTGLGGGAELIKSRMTHKMIYSLRERVHEGLESADIGQFMKEQPGQHMTRLLDDTGAIPGNLVNLWVNSVSQVGMLALGLVLLIRLNPVLSLVAVAALPFFAVTSFLLLPRIKKTVSDIRVYWSELIGHSVERLSNIETVKNYVQEKRESDEFGRLVDRSLDLNRKNNRLNLIFGSVSGIITTFAWKVPESSTKNIEGTIDQKISVKENSQTLTIPCPSLGTNFEAFILGSENKMKVVLQGYDEIGRPISFPVNNY